MSTEISNMSAYSLDRFSRVQLHVTLWTVARQVPLCMGFFRQEYWSGLSRPPPGDFPDPGLEPSSLMSHVLAGGFFTTSATREAIYIFNCLYFEMRRSIFNRYIFFSPRALKWVLSVFSHICPSHWWVCKSGSIPASECKFLELRDSSVLLINYWSIPSS